MIIYFFFFFFNIKHIASIIPYNYDLKISQLAIPIDVKTIDIKKQIKQNKTN